MKKGYLEVKLFAGDQTIPVGGATVLIKDDNGNIIYNRVTDENGMIEAVELDCPPKGNTSQIGQDPQFATYDVEIPHGLGYMRKIIHGVEIFEDITSILPVEMFPAIAGGTPEENTVEIFIPREHGVDLPKQQSNRADFENYAAENINMMELPTANEVRIPDYITVHLGSPNLLKGYGNYKK